MLEKQMTCEISPGPTAEHRTAPHSIYTQMLEARTAEVRSIVASSPRSLDSG